MNRLHDEHELAGDDGDPRAAAVARHPGQLVRRPVRGAGGRWDPYPWPAAAMTTDGHDSAQRPPRYNRIVAALGGLVYGLIQIALLVAGIIMIGAALIAVGAKKLVRMGTASE